VTHTRAPALAAGLAMAAVTLSFAAPAPTASPVPSARVRALKIVILSTMLADEGIGEWGFSALVEVDGHRILFDTGARPSTVLENARELKVDLAGVPEVVLSHNHSDHTGGLLTLRRDVKARDEAAVSSGAGRPRTARGSRTSRSRRARITRPRG
jgi:7,8-dihydropterin-6-yl-methyl-4-(beta-D-ribofuranosyl)aminobenzene 5'-phosphate synthase